MQAHPPRVPLLQKLLSIPLQPRSLARADEFQGRSRGNALEEAKTWSVERRRRRPPASVAVEAAARAPALATGVRALLISAALLAFGAGILAARTLVGLDRIVRNRFEGRLFQVASRVYSAPTMLTAGLDSRASTCATRCIDWAIATSRAPRSRRLEVCTGSRGASVAYLRAFEHRSRAEPLGASSCGSPASRSSRSATSTRHANSRASCWSPNWSVRISGRHREQREPVRLGQVPRLLIDAVLAVEDQRFEAHPGIDPWRIFGAAWRNLVAGEVRQGGSTLTQQLVKNFFLTPERSLERKLKEAAMSLLVEARYEKPAILEPISTRSISASAGPPRSTASARHRSSTSGSPSARCVWKTLRCSRD